MMSRLCAVLGLVVCAGALLTTRVAAKSNWERDFLDLEQALDFSQGDLDDPAAGRSLLTLTTFNTSHICTSAAVQGLFVLGTSNAKTGPKVTWAKAATACKAASGTLTKVTANNRKRVYTLLKTCLGLGKATSKKLATVEAWVDVVSGFKNTKTNRCTSFYANIPAKHKTATGVPQQSPCTDKLAAVCTYTPGKACGHKDGDVCDPKCVNACEAPDSNSNKCVPDKTSFTGHRCAICNSYTGNKCNPADSKLCKAAGLGGTCTSSKEDFGKFPPQCVTRYGPKKGPKAPTCAFCGTKPREGCDAFEDAVNCPAGVCGGEKDLYCILNPALSPQSYCISTAERCPSKVGATCFYDDVHAPGQFDDRPPVCPHGGGGCIGLNLRCVPGTPTDFYTPLACHTAPCPTKEGDACWPQKPTCANRKPCGTTGLHCSSDAASVSQYSCNSKICGSAHMDECDPTCTHTCGYNPVNPPPAPLSCVPDNSSSTGSRCAYCNIIPSSVNDAGASSCSLADDAICKAAGADGTCAIAGYLINSTAGDGAVAPSCQAHYGDNHNATQCGYCGSKAGDPCDPHYCSAPCGSEPNLHCTERVFSVVGTTSVCITTAELCPTTAGATCWSPWDAGDVGDTAVCSGGRACGGPNQRCVSEMGGRATQANPSGLVCTTAVCPTKKYDACYPGASPCANHKECGATGLSCLTDYSTVTAKSCQDPKTKCEINFNVNPAPPCDPSCPPGVSCSGYGANGTFRSYCIADSTSPMAHFCAYCNGPAGNGCNPSYDSRCKAAGLAGTCDTGTTPGLACYTLASDPSNSICDLCGSKEGDACLEGDAYTERGCPSNLPCGSMALYCDQGKTAVGTCKALADCGAVEGDICNARSCPSPKTCGGSKKLACALAMPLAKHTTCVSIKSP